MSGMMEEYTRCEEEECGGFMCVFHSLRPLVQEHITKLESENEALMNLAHDYIQAYEKLAFGDALLAKEKQP